MAFQRSYSKVWWGSDGHQLAGDGCYSSYSYNNQMRSRPQMFRQTNDGYYSLDFNNFKSYPENLSRIQETDDEQNGSKLSWQKRDSPGSLRSQDSGFSDNDEPHSTRGHGYRSSKLNSSSSRSKSEDDGSQISLLGSPHSVRSTIETPPTVIRRTGKSEFYSPLVSVSRRISFYGSPTSDSVTISNTPLTSIKSSLDNVSKHMIDVEDVQLLNDTSQEMNSGHGIVPTGDNDFSENLHECGIEVDQDICNQKRRRRISRKAIKPFSPSKRRTYQLLFNSKNIESNISEKLNEDKKSLKQNTSPFPALPDYNNETVYLGEVCHDNSLPSAEYSENIGFLPSVMRHANTGHTSTPKSKTSVNFIDQMYENPLLNGHEPSLKSWLDDIRLSYDHEVMSTLQTKSIVQEAFKNLTITTNTVAKLIRQLQQRGLCLQADFERMERMLNGSLSSPLDEALDGTKKLLKNVTEFTLVLERRAVFFTESRLERRKFDEHIEQIRIVTRDTQYSLERQQYISLESLMDDVLVLKRYLLFAVRLVFERMVHVIVQSIEQGRCDLMIRANINMVATLMNIDYDGFASLTDAFVQTEAVRTLLIICIEHTLSSVRALALRALATICSAPEPIVQLSTCGGIEILRDILQAPDVNKCSSIADIKRSDTERREAVSLLTQITAFWHGPEHRVDGLKDSIETIVEGLTQIISRTTCAQTMLLCAAALNNLSRTEITSHYSIMSNEAIFRLIETIEQREKDTSIFFCEQVVGMLHNMSLNKKCHSHLANEVIVSFITSAYEAEFYKNYNSRAETESQQRTIKAILHTLTRLVHDSSLGVELLEQQRVPAFLRLINNSNDKTKSVHDSYHERDITSLARQLLHMQKQGLQDKQSDRNHLGTENSSELKLNCTRHESYV